MKVNAAKSKVKRHSKDDGPGDGETFMNGKAPEQDAKFCHFTVDPGAAGSMELRLKIPPGAPFKAFTSTSLSFTCLSISM